MDEEIERRVKSCHECQSNRADPRSAPLQPWKWPSRPWARLHIDFAGPFMGHTYLVLIDAYSKWMEVVVMSSITAESTIRSLQEIFARFGLPEHVVTDNGPTFISTEFESFLQRNGSRHSTSAPYHPATNGLAEKGVQIMKAGLKKMKEGNLSTKLSRFLLSYRITPQSTTGVAPAELLMGRRLRTALDCIKPDLDRRVEKEQE